MGSPAIFSGRFTKLLSQLGIMTQRGSVIGNDGPKNLIGYNNFENGLTAGWSLGVTGTLTNGIPTGTPTFGSGASGTLALTAQSSNPIAGYYSLQLADSAATTVGDMVSTDAIPVDPEQRAQVLTFKHYFQVTANPSNGNFSGTSSNTFGIAAWDVTNSSWLPLCGNFSMTQNSGVGLATGTFQTNITTASIRFIIYCANASSGAITLLFDDFYLGPQTAPIGPVATNWTIFTPTGTWVSNTTYAGRWRRVGDSAEIQYYITTSGAPTSAALYLNTPPGLVIDTAKLAGGTSYGQNLAMIGHATDIGASNYAVTGRYATTTTFEVITLDESVNRVIQNGPVNQALPFTWGSGDFLSLEFKVPIVGWSSNVQMSNDTDTRVVDFYGTQSSTAAYTSLVTDIPFNTVKDSHGAWNGTTYTVPVAGDYNVVFTMICSPANFFPTVFYNGSLYQYGTLQSSPSQSSSGSVFIPNCKPGDTITLRIGTSGNLIAGGSMGVFRLSGPSVIAATESVNMRAIKTSGSVSSGSVQTVASWTSKDFDSHNAFNITTGEYVVPVSGVYSIGGTVSLAANSTGGRVSEIHKNGSNIQSSNIYTSFTDVSAMVLYTLVKCNANDILKFATFQNSGGSLNYDTNAGRNTINISRVGN